MLADTLKQINEAEEKSDNIIAKANQTIQDLTKQTYQEIAKINADTDAEIAKAIAQLPKVPSPSAADFSLNLPESKMTEAVNFITQSFMEEFATK